MGNVVFCRMGSVVVSLIGWAWIGCCRWNNGGGLCVSWLVFVLRLLACCLVWIGVLLGCVV